MANQIPEASYQQRAYDLSEAILRCWSAGQPYVSEAARADMIAIIHAHDAAVRAEQAASDTARIHWADGDRTWTWERVVGLRIGYWFIGAIKGKPHA